jgi:PadR family transcriptional regulator PadR
MRTARTGVTRALVEHGSLYPALHRMERKGWIISKWEMAKERNRSWLF